MDHVGVTLLEYLQAVLQVSYLTALKIEKKLTLN